MKTALLVIDVQKIYTSRDSELFCNDSSKTVARINQLIGAFTQASRPIILVRHIHRRDGSDIGRMFDFSGEPEDDFNFKDGDQEIEFDSRLQIPPGSKELRKTRYSSFVGTELDSLLHELGASRVVICGFMTNFCCDSTARSAHDLDFHVDFIVDATGTPGTENMSEKALRKAISETIQSGIGRVLETTNFLKEWDRN